MVSTTKRNALRDAVGRRSGTTSKASGIIHRKFGEGEALFERYYRAQGICSTSDCDGDFERFLNALRTPLPATFRTHANHPGRKTVNDAIEATNLAVRVMENAWEAMNPSGEMKRGRPAVPRELLDVFEQSAKNGTGARQEIVSMLPVLALDPKPGTRVLDVCAAPGQKTMQLLERVRPTSGEGTAGVVHANDAHPGRARTLLDAIDRHGRSVGERVGLLVTRAFGQDLHCPLFANGDLKRESRRVEAISSDVERRDALIELGGYDHVLADVPCSGDGTIRKDPDALVRWHTGIGNELHTTQLAVAKRCARLLKPGGTMVYSTCTFNPIEDEAVVCALLADEDLSLELVPVDFDKIQGREGLSSWKVGENHVCEDASDDADVAIKWFADLKSATKQGVGRYVSSMWPPEKDVIKKFKIERCRRFLPHDANTGGFFVAKLQRRNDEDVRRAFASFIESELELRCHGPAAQKSEKKNKKRKVTSMEERDEVLDRLVPVHRMSKELAQTLRERFGSKNVHYSIDSSRKHVYVGVSTASAVLDRACGESVRLARNGILLLRPDEEVNAESDDASWSALLDELQLTSDGAEALRTLHQSQKLPASWLPCLPTEIGAVLELEGDAVSVDELSDQTQKLCSKLSCVGPVVMCLRKKSGDVIFAAPAVFDGKSIRLPGRVASDDDDAVQRLRESLRDAAGGGAHRKRKKSLKDVQNKKP
jgi:tRNA (cytosine34-C5)-methyltransferase